MNAKDKALTAATIRASRTAIDTMNSSEQINQGQRWFREHAAIGAQCGNCGVTFTKAIKAKSLVGIPTFTPAGTMNSLYVLCGQCAGRLKRQGLQGIPHAATGARLAAFLRSQPTRGEA